MKQKLILTDCDGVLLEWNSAFENFMNDKGYPLNQEKKCHYSLSKRHGVSVELGNKLVTEFNTSRAIRNLSPLKDSIQYVDLLKKEGFQFVAITSLGSSQESLDNRAYNLEKLFGDDTFVELICLPIGNGKYNQLSRWRDSGLFWIEDKFSNALDGHSLGLNAVLVDSDHNVDFQTSRFPRVSRETPWKDIFELIRTDYGF